MISSASLEPTSEKTVKPSLASFEISDSFSSRAREIVPSEISMCSSPSSRSHAIRPSARFWLSATSVSVPPSTTGMSWAR